MFESMQLNKEDMSDDERAKIEKFQYTDNGLLDIPGQRCGGAVR